VYPREHFLVAFVPVVVYVALRDRRRPSLGLVWVVFVGSQLPDLIDKPLGNYLDLLPSGRVFFHSLPIAIPVSVVAIVYAHKTERLRAGIAFVFAYLLHIAGDSYPSFLRSSPFAWSDLLWPLTPPTPRPEIPGWAGPNQIHVTIWTGISVVILCLALGTLVRDVRREFG
jgi:hypothetical protein